ncbi:MAG TPA: zf-HC2 domain-containing protein [Terracidiphilus sp.]|nr:zf-HC2 domain-containing protein [Terracidiphilus sp.]
MNGCDDVHLRLTEYIDGRLSGREMQDIDAHLAACDECARESESLGAMQASLARLGPVPEPEDLPLRIRVAVSQERARSRRSIFAAWGLAWKNTVGPLILQASAGFASAVVLLGTIAVLATVFARPEAAQATPDEPLGDATAPRLLGFSDAQGKNGASAISSSVVVEAYVNDKGEVYDYRIVSGPTDATTREQVENLLLFSSFEPAKFYGQPVRGLAVLSFAGVSVRG